MARLVRLAAALLLVVVCGFLIWSGVVVGLRAFDSHPDSQPWTYLAAGGIYITLGCVCGLGSMLLFRWRR